MEINSEQEESKPISINANTIQELKRERTDQIFTWILIVIELGFLFITFYSQYQSMPRKLGRGVDFRGVVCGQTPLQNLPYLYKLIPSTDSNIQICVNQCPSSTGPQICMYQKDGITKSTFCYQQTKTFKLGYFCVQTEYKSRQILDNYMMDSTFVLQRYLSNLIQGKSQFFISLGCGIIIILLIKRLFQYISYILNAMIVFSQVILFSYAYFFYQKYINLIQFRCINNLDKYQCGGRSAYDNFNLTIIMSILGILYIIYTAKYYNQQTIACNGLQRSKILNETSKHIGVYLYFYSIMLLSFMIFSVFSLSNILTLYHKILIKGQISGNLLYILSRSSYASALVYISIILIIILTSTLKTFFEVILIISVSLWYYSPKDQKQNIRFFQGVFVSVRYNLGSINAHSIMIVIVFPVKILINLILIFFNLPLIKSLNCAKSTSRKLKQFYEKIDIFKIQNFIFSAILGQNYFKCNSYRQQIKQANYKKIYELDTIFDNLIFHLCISISLICTLIQYLIMQNSTFLQISNYQFKVQICFVIFVAYYLFYKVLFCQITLLSKIILYVGLIDKKKKQGEFKDMLKQITERSCEFNQTIQQIQQHKI